MYLRASSFVSLFFVLSVHTECNPFFGGKNHISSEDKPKNVIENLFLNH